jgi:hypothetical protein
MSDPLTTPAGDPSTTSASAAPRPKRRYTHQRPTPISLDELQNDLLRVRVSDWLYLLRISASSFYAQLAAGAIPPADGHDGIHSRYPNPYWRAATVRAYLQK